MAGSLFPIEGVLIANMQSNLYNTNVDTVSGHAATADAHGRPTVDVHSRSAGDAYSRSTL